MIRRFSNDKISIDAFNSGGTKILNIQTTDTIEADNWYHLMFSFDLSNTSKRHLYLDDVSKLGVAIYTNDTIDFTIADWGYAARPDGSNKFNGAAGEFWFYPGQYLDLSVESNRRKFITADKRPAGVSSDGSYW